MVENKEKTYEELEFMACIYNFYLRFLPSTASSLTT